MTDYTGMTLPEIARVYGIDKAIKVGALEGLDETDVRFMIEVSTGQVRSCVDAIYESVSPPKAEEADDRVDAEMILRETSKDEPK